jgi:hypothetical protein
MTVNLQRDSYRDGDEEFSVLTFDKVLASNNTLTAAERDYIIEQVCESHNEDQIINALLRALAGKSSRL